ncbi:MAG: hypothetical protein JW715_17210, partial [Sedimentisphaerales bacterium]|nr:hypothetical protein [Sedimentisphaerales bacterium]
PTGETTEIGKLLKAKNPITHATDIIAAFMNRWKCPHKVSAGIYSSHLCMAKGAISDNIINGTIETAPKADEKNNTGNTAFCRSACFLLISYIPKNIAETIPRHIHIYYLKSPQQGMYVNIRK